MPAVTFAPNVPAQLALREADPREEGHQWRFLLVDGRDLVVSPDLAVSIDQLDLMPGELFWICKRWDGDPTHRAQWDMWRDPSAEKSRAALEIEAANKSGDLVPILRDSIAIVERRKNTPAPRPTAAQEPPTRSTGTFGPQPRARQQPAPAPAPSKPVRLPYNVAVREVVQFVAQALKDSGEQWSDEARQDLCSTCLIEIGRQGHLTIWERS